MLEQSLKELPAHAPIRLCNETCVYCGAKLDRSTRSKEHVLARRFVPKGKLNGQWNLIVWACKRCNVRKSDLEDDLSAITMQPDAFGSFAHEDGALAADALRKGQNAFSRRTKRPVGSSQERTTINVPFGPGVEFTFTLMGPPQADRERIFELARLHVMAFFYWVTFNQTTRRGGFWPGGFFPVLEAACADWGNPVQRAFMDAVVDWEPRVLAIGADGFFKVAIRRHPSADCWSWALEWNHRLRVVGFFGDLQAAEEVWLGFPRTEMRLFPQESGQFVGGRIETPLQDVDDKLFSWNPPPSTVTTEDG